LEIAKHSPAGEDLNFTFDNSPSTLIGQIVKFVDGFDAEEHATFWVTEGSGMSGVPSLRILLQDAEDIQNMLNDLKLGLQTIEFGPAPESYKTFEDVQNTIMERAHDPNWNYYSGEFVCTLHIKFGDMTKRYYGLDTANGLTEEFVEEFEKFYEGEPCMFKTPTQVIEYVKTHNLPVIFYDNYKDRELSLAEVTEYFKK
jgi:hypothetical protein